MPGQTLDGLVARLRDHIIGALHLGELESGGRLPSIREVARELGEDQRRVARAYRALAAEGLVEVRGRSGVYAAPQARLGGGMLEETAEWLAGVFLEGWKRRIAPRALPALAEECVSRLPVRCAFVDSCEDAMEAFTFELREEFGFDVDAVWLHAVRGVDVLAGAGAGASAEEEITSLQEADLLVTTIFNATSVRRLAQKLSKPMIVVNVHPQAAATVVAHLQQNTLTLVCADPSFGDRMRLQYEEHGAEHRLHIVLAEDAATVAGLDAEQPVLLTRAARKRLGDIDVKLLIPHSPTLSPASAHELIRFMVRLNTERRASDGGAP